MPIPKVLIDNFSQYPLNSLINSFSLSITLGVIRYTKGMLNLIPKAKCIHVMIPKILPIISDDSMGNSKATYNMILNELDYLGSCSRHHRNSLNPLGKVLSGCNYELMPP